MAKTTEKNLASLLACLSRATPNAAPYSELNLETEKYSVARKKVFKFFKVVEKEVIELSHESTTDLATEVAKIKEALARHRDHFAEGTKEIRKFDGDLAKRKEECLPNWAIACCLYKLSHLHAGEDLDMAANTSEKIRAIVNDFSTIHNTLRGACHATESRTPKTLESETNKQSRALYDAAKGYLEQVKDMNAEEKIDELVRQYVSLTKQDEPCLELAGAVVYALYAVAPNGEVDKKIPEVRLDHRPAEVQAAFENINLVALEDIDLGNPDPMRLEMEGMLGNVTEDFENLHKLIELDNKRSGRVSIYKGPIPRCCQIESTCETDGVEAVCNLPIIAGSNHKGTELKLKVEGIPFETCLKLELVIHGQDGKVLHTGCLRFFPNGVFTLKPQITSFEYGIFEAATVGDDPTATDQVSYATVQLTTFGGIGHQLDVVDDDFDTEAQALLTLLNLWNVDHHPDRTNACKFRIKVAFDPDHKDIEQFWASMEELKTENLPNIRKPLHAYCDNNGRPAIVLGMIPSRKTIKSTYDSLVKYRFKKSFSHPYEYGVTMAYGTFLEHQRELQLITAMQRSLHQMTVYDYEDTIVVAIALNEELNVEDRYRVTPGSNVTINWKRNGVSVSSSETVRGVIYDHWFAGIPEKYTVVVVNPESRRYIEDLAQNVAAPDRKFYEAKITFDVNEIPVRRRIEAVNRLISDNFVSWHPAIMARSSASLTMHDLTDCFKPDHPMREQMIKRSFDKILNRSNLNPDQRNAFNLIRSAPGGILDIEGCPGGGKTWLLVIIALALRELDIYVLFAAPTHAAADAIMKTSKMVAKATGLTLEIKRAYSSPHETEAFFNEAKQEGVLDEGLDLAKISKNDNMRTVVLLKTITALGKKYASKQYALTEDSLERAVIDRAKAKQNDVHFPMTAANHVLAHKELGTTLPPDFSDENPDEVFPVQVYELINLFLDLMERTPKVEEWTEGLGTICTKAFKWAQEDIVRECGCIVTTTNNVAGTPIANGVGALPEYAGIVALIDESNRDLEQDTAIVLTGLKQSKMLQGVVSAGDAKQPPPLVLTDNETPAYNEMSAQMAVSLPSRIVKARHPQATLKYNGRAHPELNAWPNKNNYYGMLTDTEVVKALPLNKNYEEAIRMLVKEPDPKISVRLVVLSVPDSYCFTPAGSTSKVNYANVRTVVSLVAANYRAGGYSAEDIRIMSPWAKQAEALSSNLLQLALNGAVPYEHIPEVKTVHGMQGGQAKCIIFDGTVSHADRTGDVGHIRNEELFNVATTRAREAAIILLPHGLASGQLSAKFWRRINGPPGGDRLHGIAPIAYIHDMNAEGKVYILDEPLALPEGIKIDMPARPKRKPDAELGPPIDLTKEKNNTGGADDSGDKKTPVGADWTGEQEAGAQGGTW